MQLKMVLSYALKVLTINKGPQNRILQILQNYTLQYDELKSKKAQLLWFYIGSVGVLNQWKHEADEAIKVLEELTENEFFKR
jgi:hypothetical protein